MASEPSAEPTTSTPGLSGSLTAGAEAHIDTAQTAIGKLGKLPDLGFLEQALLQILSRSGTPKQSIQDTAEGITLFVRLWFLDWLESSTLDTASQKTEPPKPENTSTSESQNEEVG